MTMAGLNPARDLVPRLFSSLAGWGSVPFTTNGWGWLFVYVAAPLLGGWLGAGFYTLWLRPAYAAQASP
jgi:glycerol uptake facilitator protein